MPIDFDPAVYCEQKLSEKKEYNEEKGILPSENKVIDRLRERRVETREVYDEVLPQLPTHGPAIDTFLGVICRTAAFWSPGNTQSFLDDRRRLVELNDEIARKAKKLGRLIEQRDAISNRSGFYSDTEGSVPNLIEMAAKTCPLFEMRLKEPLDQLACQFDLKYWPSIPDLLSALADDAEQAHVRPVNAVTGAATQTNQASLAGFVRAFLEALAECRESEGGHIPNSFELSDKALATILNCALDLGPDEMKDSTYIKRLRQSDRES